MTSIEIKKTVLRYLHNQQMGIKRGLAFPATTAKLAKNLKIPPRPLRAALKTLHEHGVIKYDRHEHGWMLPR